MNLGICPAYRDSLSLVFTGSIANDLVLTAACQRKDDVFRQVLARKKTSDLPAEMVAAIWLTLNDNDKSKVIAVLVGLGIVE